MSVSIDETTLTTPLGHALHVFRFALPSTTGPTIVISPATGVLQRFYRKFATYFAHQGYTVYTFNYWGIGKHGSEISQLKANRNNLTSWGQNDQASVIAHAKRERPDRPLVLITHSVGGQVFGLNPKNHLCDQVIMVASQSGYWKQYHGGNRVKIWIFWHVMIPILIPLFGYFPAKKLGLFENLPKEMTLEWAKWGKRKTYMRSPKEKDGEYFENVRAPMLLWSFPRDPFATKSGVDWLADQFSNAEVQRIHYQPEKGDAQPGHFGFFKEQFKTPFWDHTHKWIQNKISHG
ncbi:MAG: alpha/beta hydrolase [Flavobacteriaceae bacterium]